MTNTSSTFFGIFFNLFERFSKMPSKGKPAKSAKPAATPKKAAGSKPAASTAKAPLKPAPKAPLKAAAKSAEPKAKELVKKKPAAAEAKSTSVRRTNAKAEPVKPAPKAAPVAVKPLTISDVPQEGEIKHSVFVKMAKQKLLDLKDSLMDSMTGTASETLRNKAEGSEASAFGMHQADAGTDAYDRDFALSLLSQEQDALYEIEEALKRVEAGTYGVCEMSNKRIPQARLEALPFTRYTVACQERIERQQMGGRGARPVRSLFGLDDAGEASGDSSDEEEGETLDSNRD